MRGPSVARVSARRAEAGVRVRKRVERTRGTRCVAELSKNVPTLCISFFVWVRIEGRSPRVYLYGVGPGTGLALSGLNAR